MQLDLVRGLMFYSFHSSGEVRRPAGLPVQVSLHIREAMTQRHDAGSHRPTSKRNRADSEPTQRWPQRDILQMVKCSLKPTSMRVTQSQFKLHLDPFG